MTTLRSVMLFVGIACALGPVCLLGQVAPVAPTSKPTTSLADSLRRSSSNQTHIFYVHGIGSDGPKDFDSWQLRKSICKKIGCTTPSGELDGREYADRDEFALDAAPPELRYLGQPVWRKDAALNSSKEWNAAAPYVDHWKLARRNGLPVYVDEINWWPLVFSLKCRQIVASDALLVGPNKKRIKLCSTLEKADEKGRFNSYDWIPEEDVAALLSHPSAGGLFNRKLKNGLLDWNLSEVVVALGPLHTLLVDGIRQLILKSVAVTSEGVRVAAPNASANQEYVIVSHSLGSYLIFSALDITASTPKTSTVQNSGDAFAQILSRTSLVYFFANQLRLLELSDLSVSSQNNLAAHLEAWGGLRCDYLRSLDTSRTSCAQPQIVALNDPSDLLTWTVPALTSVEVHNVAIKNAPRWLWLIENPTKAHDNYAKSKNSIDQMLNAK